MNGDWTPARPSGLHNLHWGTEIGKKERKWQIIAASNYELYEELSSIFGIPVRCLQSTNTPLPSLLFFSVTCSILSFSNMLYMCLQIQPMDHSILFTVHPARKCLIWNQNCPSFSETLSLLFIEWVCWHMHSYAYISLFPLDFLIEEQELLTWHCAWYFFVDRPTM